MARAIAERADVIPLLAEVFRENGFEGASLAVISRETGLGKGSLYHFFPGGKEEMAAAVLQDIDLWFDTHIFQPLRATGEPREAIAAMCSAVESYFRSGRRICLVGAFALDNVRDRFAATIRAYFTAWTNALADVLERAGASQTAACERAEEAVIAIQGALVMSRALDDPALFTRALARARASLLA